MFEAIFEQIQKFDTIIIHRHKNPDGDAIGSQVGLKEIIKENFPGKTVYTVGDEAGRYAFMDESEMDVIADEVYADALAIVLDTSGVNLICDDRYKIAAKSARIDHHLFIEQICEVEVIDSSFESCCGLIACFAKEQGLKLNPIAAKSLYTGMVTDSGRFVYDSTTAKTFEMAAFIRSTPFEVGPIYTNLYADDFAAVKRKAQWVMKIQFTEKNVAYIMTTKEEVAASGTSTFNISRGMVATMGNIRGVDIWANFTECEEGVYCELRSSKYNINPIAVKYGGGGHEKASGATLKNFDEARAMLKDLDAMMP